VALSRTQAQLDFWEWRKEGGLTCELGEAAVSNVRFVDTTVETFLAPNDFVTAQ